MADDGYTVTELLQMVRQLRQDNHVLAVSLERARKDRDKFRKIVDMNRLSDPDWKVLAVDRKDYHICVLAVTVDSEGEVVLARWTRMYNSTEWAVSAVDTIGCSWAPVDWSTEDVITRTPPVDLTSP